MRQIVLGVTVVVFGPLALLPVLGSTVPTGLVIGGAIALAAAAVVAMAPGYRPTPELRTITFTDERGDDRRLRIRMAGWLGATGGRSLRRRALRRECWPWLAETVTARMVFKRLGDVSLLVRVLGRRLLHSAAQMFARPSRSKTLDAGRSDPSAGDARTADTLTEGPRR